MLLFIAVITTIVAIVLIAALHGYGLADWTVTSWIGGLFIVIAVYVCTKCRIEDPENNGNS